MTGTLYLVGTPIGNLGDLSPRAVETLSSADFIAAEDTRVTLKLLNHYGLKKPMICYFEHNRAEMGEKLLSRLLAGESCALVTGLALSGLPTQRFCFEGFLSVTAKSRREHLESLRGEKRTMIFYEAPHKLLRTLEDFLSYFGDRDVALCRELTKLHEEVLRTTVSGALEYFRAAPPRGEFVLVLRGAAEETGPRLDAGQALALVEQYRDGGSSLKEACRLAAEASGLGKNELYQLYLKNS